MDVPDLEEVRQKLRERLRLPGERKRLSKLVGEPPAFESQMTAYNSLPRIASGDIERPSYQVVEAVAKAIGMSSAPRRIPVISLAPGKEGQAFTDQGYPAGGGMYEIEGPSDLRDPHAFAVQIREDSMAPKYDPGQVVFVDTTKAPVNNDYAVVGLVSGEKYVTRWRWRQRDGLVTLESVNADYKPVKVRREKVAFAYKIVGTKER